MRQEPSSAACSPQAPALTTPPVSDLGERVWQDTDDHDAWTDAPAPMPAGAYVYRVTLGGQGSFDMVSNGFLRFVQAEREALLADPDLAARNVHPDDRPALVVPRHMSEGQQPFRWQGRYLHGDRVIWASIESYPRADSNGDTLWEGVIIDISARRAAEQGLRRQRWQERELHRLSLPILQASPSQFESRMQDALAALAATWNLDWVGVALHHGEQRQIDYALEWSALTDKRPAPFAGQALSAYSRLRQTLFAGQPWFCHQRADAGPTDASPERQALRQARLGAVVVVPSWLNETLVGHVAFGRFPGSRAIPVSDGQLLHAAGDLLQISLRQRAIQTEVMQGQQRETIRTLAEGLAHDFNNVLAVIGANVEQLRIAMERSDPPMPQALIKPMDDIADVLAQSRITLSSLMAFGNLGAIPTEAVDVSASLGPVLASCRYIMPGRIDYRTQVGPDLQALSNQQLLSYAVINLIFNAIEAISGQGSIAVSARRVDIATPFPTCIGSVGVGEHVEISVRDSGRGIAPEQRERLFEPSYSERSDRRGSGLGLYMVKEFLLQTGAAMVIDSTPGAGATFQMFLEVPRELASQAPVQTRTSDRRTHDRPTVLLVEDDPRLSKALVRMLETRWGLHCIPVEHGGQAIDVINRNDRLDLVLSDLAMPVIGGLELSALIQQERPDCPVLLMSGQGDSKMPHATPDNVIGLLRKPLDAGMLGDYLKRLLNKTAPPVGFTNGSR